MASPGNTSAFGLKLKPNPWIARRDAMNNESKTEIREYLLGRIADAPTLENIEERLFSDDEFCSQVEVAEEELVHDYVFGKLSPADRRSFDEKIAGNSELRFKADMAEALKEKARHETAAEKRPGFLETIKAFLQTPAYAGAFAVLLIAILTVTWFALRSPAGDPLAQLKSVYQTERPVEPRISDFFYAPAGPTTRGAATPGDADNNKLRLIETRLLEAVLNSPTAENYRALGVFRLTQKEFAEAIKNLSKAVELDDKTAKFHNDLGAAYLAAAENTAADKKIEQLARANEEFSKAVDLDPQFLEALFNRSLTLQKMANLPNQAKDSWNLYLQKDPASKWADEARAHLAELEKQQGAVKKKDDILPDIRAAFRGKDMQTVWNIHSQTKGTFNNSSPTEQLTAAYLKARQERDDGQAGEITEILNHIGKFEKEKKNADFFFAELAAFYEKIEDINIDKLLEAKNGMAVGREIIPKGKAAEAIALFEKSKKIFRELNDPAEEYVADLWVAQTLPDIGEIGESNIRLNSLIRSSEDRKFEVLLPTAYYWIGTGEGKQQKSSLSIKSFQKALQKAEAASALYEIRHSGQELASAYNDLEEPERAVDYYDKVIDKIGTYPEGAQTARNLVTFAEVFGKLGLNSTAADFALEGFNMKEDKSLLKTNLINASLRELTGALARKGRFAEALKFADESNQIALSGEPSADKDITIADTYLARGVLKYQMENCDAALADYDKSLEFYNRVPETTYNLYKVHKGKLLCFQAPGRQDEFDAELETVLRLSEEYRQNIREDSSRQAFFNSEQDVFDAAIANALRQNDNQKAFRLVEDSRARSLLDFVRSDKPIAEVQKEFAAVAKPLPLSEIQARLPEDLQVIQYAVLSEKVAIWTLTKDRVEYSEKAIAADKLKKEVSDYLRAVRSRASAAELKPAARELYDLLLPRNIESGKTLCLIPDKSLHQVPFASLVSEDGKFLIENSPIFYSPSASVLVLTSENARQKEQVKEEHLLGIGNPHFDREENPNLPDLPQAEAEIAAIAKDYPGPLKFTGDQATKENFLSNFSHAEVIHFAGHFVANDRLPGYSKLLFSGDNLRSFELADYRLPKAKLVVLSACETGLESYNYSEGAIGIARTFLAAGVPLVLASSWTVDSEATRDLMIAFHRNRKGKGAKSAESLRQAQLQLLQNTATAAPYYWSAFNPVGGYTNY